MTQITALEDKLHHHFSDKQLLKLALSHRSASKQNNERLEFLGDAILSFIIADELYHRYPEMKEGELSRLRSGLVNSEVLAEIAGDVGLGEFLRLGMGEKRSGGMHRQSINADAVEALIGAIYLDSDLQTTRRCVLQWFEAHFDNLSELKPAKDAKSSLQEWLQAHKFPLPTYIANVSGKAHEQEFRVVCRVEGLPHESEGVSTSRRKAEQIAAKHYLDLLDE